MTDPELAEEEQAERDAFKAWRAGREFNDGSSRPILQPRLRLDADGNLLRPSRWTEERLAFELYRAQNRLAFLLSQEYGDYETEPAEAERASRSKFSDRDRDAAAARLGRFTAREFADEFGLGYEWGRRALKDMETRGAVETVEGFDRSSGRAAVYEARGADDGGN